MNKSELISRIAARNESLAVSDVKLVVEVLLDEMAAVLSNDRRIEIRGFGSFPVHYRAARVARNPRTGEKIMIGNKCIPYFKPGKILKARVNQNSQ